MAYAEGLVKIKLPSGVFMNPPQVFNRDLSVLAISTFSRRRWGKPPTFSQTPTPSTDLPSPPSIRVLEGLSATGLRAIRYAKEVRPPIAHITANDISLPAVELMRENFAANEVSAYTIENKDAVELMYSGRREAWDVVDIDPYGSAAEFLDAAVQATRNYGLLCVTSTDMATLCGTHADTCFYKYGGVPSDTKHCHESALRLLLHALQQSANRYQRVIVPMMSISVDFYIRVFVQIVNFPKKAKDSILTTGLILQCQSCPAYYVQRFGRQAKGKNLPATFDLPSECSECGGRLVIEGPTYLGPLHHKEFISHMISNLPEFAFHTRDRIEGLLCQLREELEQPLAYDLSQLCQFIKCSPPPQQIIRSALRSLNYQVSQAHTKPLHYKTDAPVSVLFDILKLWVTFM